MKKNNYRKPIIMIFVSFIIMYAVMFLNVDKLDHIYLSTTRAYMSILMVTPMAIMMLFMMPMMYENKKLNMIIILAFVCSVFASDKGLPREPDTTEVKIEKLASSKDLILDFSVVLPPGQKLGGSSSFVAVYERKNREDWTETQRFRVQNAFGLFKDIRLREKVALRSPDSEIAVHSTIYHCGEKKGCFIQGFQGTTGRKAGASAAIPFHIQGKTYGQFK